MAQWVKMLTTAKSVALRFPGTHQVEGKNQLLQTVLFPNSYCGDLTYATCKINVIIKKTQVGVAHAIYQNAPEVEASQVQGLPELYTKFNEGQDILLLACARYNK